MSNVIFAYGMHLFYAKFFPKSEGKWAKWLTLILFLILDFILYLLISNSYIFPIVSFILFFSVTLTYQCRIDYRNFLAAFWILIFGICGELLASYVVSFFMGKIGLTSSENALVAALVSARFFFFFVAILSAKLISHHREGEPIRYIFVLTMFLPMISIGLVVYVFSLAEFDQNTILNAGSFGAVMSVSAIVLLNLITVWLFDRQTLAYQTEQEAQALRKTVQVQQEHYNGEMKRHEAIRKVKHDYKNLLLAIQASLDSQRINDARRIIKGELEEVGVSDVPQSGWYALDAIVAYKEASAEKVGLRLLPEYFLEETPKVASEDICVMMGNAIDNAMEYLEENPACSKEIRIHVHYEKGVLNIKVGNEVEGTIATMDRRFCKSSKTEEGHGYGLKSIDYIAGKYDGRLILSSRENYFECGMILYC
ncbi:MAG: GHKL domain-containing protein [Lachnospiraceae bacterium]|nr:GHKL domain-containing protein [Lachnospiraceae bacterium]